MNNIDRKNTLNDCAILVLSCDKYCDLWKPFFELFHKFWSRCPFTVYLGSNTKKFRDYSIPTILSKSCIDWSSDLLSILAQMKEEYIFIWIDDFFPMSSIDTKLFIRGFEFMKMNKANHIHIPSVVGNNNIDNNKVIIIQG